MYFSKITGTGFYVPENVVTNKDLTAYMDTTEEWIVERTGILERRFVTPGKDTTSTMAAEACKKALDDAGLTPQDIDAVVFATLSPDYYFPGCGVLLLKHLNIPGKAALDVRAQCGGFVYALSVADQYIRTGMYKRVLVACSEVQSNILELSTRGRNIAVIFGDGAGAVVLEAHQEKGKGVLSTHLHGDGTFAEELFLRHPGACQNPRITEEMLANGSMLPHMNGNLVFKHAVVRFEEVITEALEHNGYTKDDLNLLIPHQANLRISNYIQERFGLSDDRVYNNIQRYGNTTAASIPIALSEARSEGRVNEGDLVCFAAFGSGFIWASALVRF
jgi:3-oxoacyl-[acyl-carrier-protein] synthase-3